MEFCFTNIQNFENSAFKQHISLTRNAAAAAGSHASESKSIGTSHCIARAAINYHLRKLGEEE